MHEQVPKELIVSMTSHPARINNVALVVETIYKQTRLPDKVILWLGESRFPGKYADLPKELVKLATDKKLDVRWCDDVDLKPHTKYFYAFKEYPDALIITVDDDILYHPKLIENLYNSYGLNILDKSKIPVTISMMRMMISPDQKVLNFTFNMSRTTQKNMGFPVEMKVIQNNRKQVLNIILNNIRTFRIGIFIT